MAVSIWRYLINTFEVTTRGSHVKGLSLATDHDSKLHAEDADPEILALYTPFHTLLLAYAQICSHYDSVSGIRKGMTSSLEQVVGEDLADKLREWEPIVRTVHPEDSPQEIMIFPNKRTPFTHGTYEDRINAIASLIESLQANGGFATLVTQVQSFHNLAVSTRDTQQQQEGLIGQSSDLRENQRLLIMKEMHGNFGRLIQKFHTDIIQVERFFDMSMLRNSSDGENIIDTKQGIVAAGMKVNLGALPAGTAKVRMKALDGGPLEFGMSADGLNFNGNTTAMSAGAETTYLIADFASTGTTFVVFNQNGSAPGEYKVEFLG